MSEEILEEMTQVKMTRKILEDMTEGEIDQFLTCARVGRVGICLGDEPYVVPVGYGYEEGEIFFHTCYKGLKMEGMEKKPKVCFEVDEYTSDASMFKSVIVRGDVMIIEDEAAMKPYLEKIINKYRIPMSFERYMTGRNTDKEMAIVRICVITPREITGRMMMRIDRSKIT
jgi:hypothetical protein